MKFLSQIKRLSLEFLMTLNFKKLWSGILQDAPQGEFVWNFSSDSLETVSEVPYLLYHIHLRYTRLLVMLSFIISPSIIWVVRLTQQVLWPEWAHPPSSSNLTLSYVNFLKRMSANLISFCNTHTSILIMNLYIFIHNIFIIYNISFSMTFSYFF